MNLSGFGKLNFFDFLKGALLAVISGALQPIIDKLSGGSWPTSLDWKTVLPIGASVFIGYLIKQVFTNSQGQLLTKEPK